MCLTARERDQSAREALLGLGGVGGAAELPDPKTMTNEQLLDEVMGYAGEALDALETHSPLGPDDLEKALERKVQAPVKVRAIEGGHAVVIDPSAGLAKPKRKARSLDDIPDPVRTLGPEDYLEGTVQLSNKACPRYYGFVEKPKRPCGCPKGRCWYDEQLRRRAEVKLALTPEAWHELLEGKARE